MMNDEIKMAIRNPRDADGQSPGVVTACNAVLGSTASKATRERIIRLALATSATEQGSSCACVAAGVCDCHFMHITERCECSMCTR